MKIKPIGRKGNFQEEFLKSKQSVTCPACGQKISLTVKELMGKKFRCPKCKEEIPIVKS